MKDFTRGKSVLALHLRTDSQVSNGVNKISSASRQRNFNSKLLSTLCVSPFAIVFPGNS